MLPRGIRYVTLKPSDCAFGKATRRDVSVAMHSDTSKESASEAPPVPAEPFESSVRARNLAVKMLHYCFERFQRLSDMRDVQPESSGDVLVLHMAPESKSANRKRLSRHLNLRRCLRRMSCRMGVRESKTLDSTIGIPTETLSVKRFWVSVPEEAQLPMQSIWEETDVRHLNQTSFWPLKERYSARKLPARPLGDTIPYVTNDLQTCYHAYEWRDTPDVTSDKMFTTGQQSVDRGIQLSQNNTRRTPIKNAVTFSGRHGRSSFHHDRRHVRLKVLWPFHTAVRRQTRSRLFQLATRAHTMGAGLVAWSKTMLYAIRYRNRLMLSTQKHHPYHSSTCRRLRSKFSMLPLSGTGLGQRQNRLQHSFFVNSLTPMATALNVFLRTTRLCSTLHYLRAYAAAATHELSAVRRDCHSVATTLRELHKRLLRRQQLELNAKLFPNAPLSGRLGLHENDKSIIESSFSDSVLCKRKAFRNVPKRRHGSNLQDLRCAKLHHSCKELRSPLSSQYNGSPRRFFSCDSLNCLRDDLRSPSLVSPRSAVTHDTPRMAYHANLTGCLQRMPIGKNANTSSLHKSSDSHKLPRDLEIADQPLLASPLQPCRQDAFEGAVGESAQHASSQILLTLNDTANLTGTSSLNSRHCAPVCNFPSEVLPISPWPESPQRPPVLEVAANVFIRNPLESPQRPPALNTPRENFFSSFLPESPQRPPALEVAANVFIRNPLESPQRPPALNTPRENFFSSFLPESPQRPPVLDVAADVFIKTPLESMPDQRVFTRAPNRLYVRSFSHPPERTCSFHELDAKSCDEQPRQYTHRRCASCSLHRRANRPGSLLAQTSVRVRKSPQPSEAYPPKCAIPKSHPQQHRDVSVEKCGDARMDSGVKATLCQAISSTPNHSTLLPQPYNKRRQCVSQQRASDTFWPLVCELTAWKQEQDCRAEQVSQFLRSRQHVSRYVSLHNWIPPPMLRGNADHILLIGTKCGFKWTQWAAQLRCLDTYTRQIVASLIPPIDRRLLGDLEAWSRLIEACQLIRKQHGRPPSKLTTLGHIPLAEQENTCAVDPCFTSLNEHGINTVGVQPTTAIVHQLVEYVALSLHEGQRATVIFCGYLGTFFDANLKRRVYTTGDDSSMESLILLCSDFLASKRLNAEEQPVLEIQGIPIKALLDLGQLMQRDTELHVILDAGGAGIEHFIAAAETNYMDAQERTEGIQAHSVVLQNKGTPTGGTVTARYCLAPALQAPNSSVAVGHRHVNLAHVMRILSITCPDVEVHLQVDAAD